MNNIIEKAESRINAIMADSNNRRRVLEEKIDEYRACVAAAEKSMEEAAVYEDVPAYQQATAQRSEAQAAVELFERRMSQLHAEPLIPDEEYKMLLDELLEEIKSRDKAARAKLRHLAGQMKEIGEAFDRDVRHVNGLLHLLQYDIYGYRAGVRVQEGDHMTITRPERQYDGNATVSWANVAANHYQARKE